MSTIKQLWALARFQLAINQALLLCLALGSGFPCIIECLIFRDTKFPLSLDLLIRNQLIYFVLIFGPMLLAPNLGNSRKRDSIRAAGSEFLITRAVDRHLLFRSRSLLFFFLLLVIPLIGIASSLHHPELKVYAANGDLFQRILHQFPGSIQGPPDTDGKLKDISIPTGNILVGSWRIWLPLCIGVITLISLTLARKVKYIWWFLMPLGLVLLYYFCFPSVFYHGASGSRYDGQDLNTALFFFFATHQALCWLIALPALFLSLFWYEQGTEQFE